MKLRWENILYRVCDIIAAALAWYFFFIYLDKQFVMQASDDVLHNRLFLLGLFYIPLIWVVFYVVFDLYKDLYRLSRWAVFKRTLLLSIIGSIVLCVILMLSPSFGINSNYIYTYLIYFALQFGLTVIARLIILSYASSRLKKGIVGFNTLMIGSDIKARELYEDLTGRNFSLGHKFIGFVHSNGRQYSDLEGKMPCLGDLSQLETIIEQERIEEVLIAVETSEHLKLKSILDRLFEYGDRILVKIIPDTYDILLGNVKMNHIYGAVMIEVNQELMPKWQRVIKRCIDITVSVLFLIVLSPLYIFIILRTKLSSAGPIFYSQERIGLNGKPFHIYKFRSMHLDAEKEGPQLSHDTDSRITPWGQVMRKWRLDELPQFFNVLIGDMALVGPRPERKYYIDKIIDRAPHYKHLLKVRPGITSWGQVKYGYASNIEEMLQRLKFDILYIENMSLGLDFKILIYTALVLFQGKGK